MGEILKLKMKLLNSKIIELDIEDLEIDEQLKYFDLSAQRFINVFNLIKKTYTYIFERSYEEIADIIEQFYTIKIKYTFDESVYDTITFAQEIKKLLELPSFKSIVNEYIEKYYIHKENNDKKINSQLILLKEHCEDLQKISFIMKFCIPLISDFYSIHKDKFKDLRILYLDIFKLIIGLNDQHKVSNKLYKLVESRVKSTSFSDRVIWSYLENIGKDPESETLNIYDTTIVLILYKLEVDKNPISYIHAALQNQIKFIFRGNISIEYNPINPRLDEENDGITSMDKLKIEISREDEGLKCIQEVNKINEIKNFLKTFNISISKEELEYYDEIKLNKMQVNLVLLYYSKYFGTYDNYELNRKEFKVLLIALKKVLEKNKLNILAKYLMAFGDFKNKKLIMKKDFIEKLISTKIYNKIFNRYKFVSNKFLVNKDPILFFISTIYYNKWLSYDDYKNGIIEYKEPIERIEEIAYEVLSFIEQV